MMMAGDCDLENALIDGEKFIDVILKPHRSYYNALIGLFNNPALKGMAHITGGGIAGNLNRILPKGLDAEIDLSLLRPLSIFKFIKKNTGADDAELLKTFNMGAGMTIVVKRGTENDFIARLKEKGYDSYVLGCIKGNGTQKVNYINAIKY